MLAKMYREPVNAFMLCAHAMNVMGREMQTNYNSITEHCTYTLDEIEEINRGVIKHIPKGITLYLPGPYEDGPNRMYSSLGNGKLTNTDNELVGVEIDAPTYYYMDKIHSGNGKILLGDIWEAAKLAKDKLVNLVVCGTSSLFAYLSRLKNYITILQRAHTGKHIRFISFTSSARSDSRHHNFEDVTFGLKQELSKVFTIDGETVITYGSPIYGQSVMRTICFSVRHALACEQTTNTHSCGRTVAAHRTAYFGYNYLGGRDVPTFRVISRYTNNIIGLKVRKKVLTKKSFMATFVAEEPAVIRVN